VPTGEMLALFVFEKVQRRLDAEADGVLVDRVTIAEDETLSASVERR
jgi:hypothetical protein